MACQEGINDLLKIPDGLGKIFQRKELQQLNSWSTNLLTLALGV